MWFLFALVSAIADGTKSLFQKYAIREHSPWAVSFIENCISTLLFVPAALLDWQASNEPNGWLLLFLAGALWAGIAVIAYFSLKQTPVTLRAPLNQTRLIFAFVLGVLLLHERVTQNKVLGTALILLGTLLLSYHKRKLFGRLSEPGVQLALLGALLGAIVALVDKTALQYFSPGTYGLLAYTIPTVIIACVATRKERRIAIRIAWEQKKWPIALIALLAAVAYYTALNAYSGAEATAVYPVLRLSMIVSMLGSAVVFADEREDLVRRLAGAVVVTLGAFFIAGVF